MKKALPGLMAALAATGLAAPAQAASHVDFSGYYTFMYISEHNIGNAPGGGADNYLGHWFNLDFTFSPTDEVSVFWRVRAPEFARGGSSDGPSGSLASAYTEFVYGRISRPWGTINIGRLYDEADNYGLSNLGYLPISVDWGWAMIGPFDGWDNIDAIEYRNQWDNGFGLLAQYAKLVNYSPGFEALSSDYDADRWVIEPQYKWEKGGASLALIYERDAGPEGRDAEGLHQIGLPDKTKTWYLNPAFMHSFDKFSIHAEAKLGWGKIEYYKGSQAGQADTDTEGYGAYLDLDYNYGSGNLTLAGWWLSGTDMEESYKANGKSKSLVGMGGEFYPLVIAYNLNAVSWNRLCEQGVNTNAVALANNGFTHYVQPNRANVLSGGSAADIPGVTGAGTPSQALNSFGAERWVSYNNDTEANNWALSLSGSHSFTENIGLRYAVAYLGLNKANYRVLDSYKITGPGDFDQLRYRDQSKDLGWEFDVSLSFQLLDNLILTTTVGYMFVGDAYKSLKGYDIGPADSSGHRAATAVWEKGDDSYGWYNTLSFFF